MPNAKDKVGSLANRSRSKRLNSIKRERIIESIKVGPLIKRLEEAALGKKAMTATEINAAKVLINKVMPDLKAVEYSGMISHAHTSKSDIDGQLLAAGIDPEEQWAALEMGAKTEIVDAEYEEVGKTQESAKQESE